MTGLVKELNAAVNANADKKMAAFTVVLTDDADKTEEQLKALAKDAKIDKVPLTLMEGAAGPPAYHIAKDAEVTILMWKGQKVKANFAFGKGKLDKEAIKKVLEDTSKILE
ncbi:MAG: hypothetical protein ACJ8F7_08635 [Gemmataceae bacterium]